MIYGVRLKGNSRKFRCVILNDLCLRTIIQMDKGNVKIHRYVNVVN